ncbi:MAG: hypothetical protein K1X94_06640 [Sandaracinaceae bacterium]|nr:hypothetical protein [Sandaracinaceae bacterium]
MRGIAPELLVSQVRNTAPYVFDEIEAVPGLFASEPVRLLRELAARGPLTHESLTHEAYYALCLASHYVTCATPVPTDVDIQIRKKLWPPSLPLVTALAMAKTVLDSHAWDFVPLTARASHGAAGSAEASWVLHGHMGEWFTVAVGAYAALGHYRAEDAKKLRAALLDALAGETEHHSAIFGSCWRAGDGLGALRACVSIAHNFGDLDRVVVMWDLPIADPLRLRFHGLSTRAFDAEGALRHKGRLWAAGELYKSSIEGSSMAAENHRHFALRKPRVLRTRPALRVPVAPFFDAWGQTVGREVEAEALDEVLDALLTAQLRSTDSIGYARGLRGIVEVRPELSPRLEPLRKRDKRMREVLAMPREELESRWASAALRHLEDIPGRAR